MPSTAELDLGLLELGASISRTRPTPRALAGIVADRLVEVLAMRCAAEGRSRRRQTADGLVPARRPRRIRRQPPRADPEHRGVPVQSGAARAHDHDPAAARSDRRHRQRRTAETGLGPGAADRELTITAHFSAADDLGAGGAVSAVPRLFGIGPQLAALEKMVYPPTHSGGLIGAAIDAIGSALSGSGALRPRARCRATRLPRILFIWGPTRSCR